jgi:hypothetical protein
VRNRHDTTDATTSPGAARRSGPVAAVLFLSACASPLVPVFATSGDAPSRTGLTAMGEGAVFGNDAGRVFRLDAGGQVVWVVETGGEIELPLAVLRSSEATGWSRSTATPAVSSGERRGSRRPRR